MRHPCTETLQIIRRLAPVSKTAPLRLRFRQGGSQQTQSIFALNPKIIISHNVSKQKHFFTFNLYNVRFVTRGVIPGHNCKGRHMCHRPDSSCTNPRRTHEAATHIKHADKHNVQVESRSLFKFSLLFVDDQPNNNNIIKNAHKTFKKFVLLANMSLHEEQNVNQKGRNHAANCQPDLQRLIHAARVNEPTPFARTGGGKTFRHSQFVGVSVRNHVIQHDHSHYGDWHSKVTKGTARLNI
jgi:hypothetical protein